MSDAVQKTKRPKFLTAEMVVERLKGRDIQLLEFSGKANTNSLFKCLKPGCGYEWRATSNNITAKGKGCPSCAGVRKQTAEDVIRKIGDRPIELVEYAGSMLGQSTFKCKIDGHVWNGTADNITRGRGCPRCSGRAGYTFDELKDLLDKRGINLLEYSGAMNDRAKFSCRKDGCVWETSATSVVCNKLGCGCPECGRATTRVDEGEVRAKLLARDIELVSKGKLVSDIATFRCLKDGHQWSVGLRQVLHEGTGCKLCAGLVPLSLDEAKIRIQGRNIDILDYAGISGGKSTFKCTNQGCDHEWTTTLSSLTIQGTGCPVCAKAGFDQTKPGEFYIYKLNRNSVDYIGFGITGYPKDRHARHRKSISEAGATGHLHASYQMSGYAAQALESALKSELDRSNTGIEGFIREAVLYSPEMLEYIESRASACLGT